MYGQKKGIERTRVSDFLHLFVYIGIALGLYFLIKSEWNNAFIVFVSSVFVGFDLKMFYDYRRESLRRMELQASLEDAVQAVELFVDTPKEVLECITNIDDFARDRLSEIHAVIGKHYTDKPFNAEGGYDDK